MSSRVKRSVTFILFSVAMLALIIASHHALEDDRLLFVFLTGCIVNWVWQYARWVKRESR